MDLGLVQLWPDEMFNLTKLKALKPTYFDDLCLYHHKKFSSGITGVSKYDADVDVDAKVLRGTKKDRIKISTAYVRTT